jgi:uncharacterized protein YgiM (DUF1202 family)
MYFKRKHRIGLLTGFVTVILLAVSSAAATSDSVAGTVTTDTSPLMVRSAPSTSSSQSAALPRGSNVTLLSRSGSWWYVEYARNKYGYCYASYLTESAGSYAASVATAWENLNVRSGPSSSSSVQTTLPRGEIVVVLSSSSGWSKILYHGTETGYVSAAYLQRADTSSGYSAVSLSVPSYKQYDSRWASKTVGSSGQTMQQIGCTVTALAMTESYRTGTTLTPAAMLSRLSFTSGGAVYWPSNYTAYTGDAYLAKLYQVLASGSPVIIGAKNSSGQGHWVVVTGFTGGALSASSFTIQDPGTSWRTTLADLFADYPYFYKLEYAN